MHCNNIALEQRHPLTTDLTASTLSKEAEGTVHLSPERLIPTGCDWFNSPCVPFVRKHLRANSSAGLLAQLVAIPGCSGIDLTTYTGETVSLAPAVPGPVFLTHNYRPWAE